jgi:hypothetical protein
MFFTGLYVDGLLNDCAWLPDGERLVAVGDRGVYFLYLKGPYPSEKSVFDR